MPSRIIREGWIESERINALDASAERFFLRLCLRADDYGRYHANPLLLRANLFPLTDEVRSTDIPRWLAACELAGLVRCYEVEGKRLVEIARFDQRTRAKTSKFPAPPAHAGHMPDTCPPHDVHMRTEAESDSDANSESDSDSDAGVQGETASPAPASSPAELPLGEIAQAQKKEQGAASSLAGKQNAGNRTRGRKDAPSDAEWLASLKASAAYAGIDVDREQAKASVWCQTKGKVLTRPRFVNWLNRCDRPMSGPEGKPRTWQPPSGGDHY